MPTAAYYAQMVMGEAGDMQTPLSTTTTQARPAYKCLSVKLDLSVQLKDMEIFVLLSRHSVVRLFTAAEVLTEVNARLSRDRSELWRSTWSWSVGLLRHGGPWLHTWGTGLLPLSRTKTREQIIKKRNKPKMNHLKTGY